MSKTALVSIPVSRDMLETALVEGLDGPLLGFAVTPSLLSIFDLADDGEEDAEFAALLVASIVALSRWGERLVITAEVGLTQGDMPLDLANNGGVLAKAVPLASIVSWFSDVYPAVAAEAAAEAAGLDIEAAWTSSAVAALLDEHDLVWHAPIERHFGHNA